MNQDLLHHLDQLAVFQNLLHNMRVGFSIVFAVRKAAFSAHGITPFSPIIRLLTSFDKRMEPHGQGPWYHRQGVTASISVKPPLRLAPRVKPVVPGGGGWKDWIF